MASGATAAWELETQLERDSLRHNHCLLADSVTVAPTLLFQTAIDHRSPRNIPGPGDVLAGLPLRSDRGIDLS